MHACMKTCSLLHTLIWSHSSIDGLHGTERKGGRGDITLMHTKSAHLISQKIPHYRYGYSGDLINRSPFGYSCAGDEATLSECETFDLPGCPRRPSSAIAVVCAELVSIHNSTYYTQNKKKQQHVLCIHSCFYNCILRAHRLTTSQLANYTLSLSLRVPLNHQRK